MTIAIKRYKLCRRLGAPIFEKCQTEKYTPKTGKMQKGGPKRMSDFARQLLEKQKVRFMYGISEGQFKNYVNSAMNDSAPARKLFELLENRLDSVAYRLGFTNSRLSARQFVSHGHATVNGRRVDVPSYRLKIGDVVSLREATRSSKMFELRQESFKANKSPEWIQVDTQKISAKISGVPTGPDPLLDFQAVIEYYTR